MTVRQNPHNEMILRGFELVRWDGREWERIHVYRPTERDIKKAGTELEWYRERHPTTEYDLRALVSVPRPEPQPNDSMEGPLVLEEDTDTDETAPQITETEAAHAD